MWGGFQFTFNTKNKFVKRFFPYIPIILFGSVMQSWFLKMHNWVKNDLHCMFQPSLCMTSLIF